MSTRERDRAKRVSRRTTQLFDQQPEPREGEAVSQTQTVHEASQYYKVQEEFDAPPPTNRHVTINEFIKDGEEDENRIPGEKTGEDCSAKVQNDPGCMFAITGTLMDQCRSLQNQHEALTNANEINKKLYTGTKIELYETQVKCLCLCENNPDNPGEVGRVKQQAREYRDRPHGAYAAEAGALRL